MSPTEQAYGRQWEPPRFEAGRTPKGGTVLRISFAGGQSVTEWDGSDTDAEVIANSYADTSALNSEWDYWVHGGGWKEWSGNNPPTS
jgi:hypothetical protein